MVTGGCSSKFFRVGTVETNSYTTTQTVGVETNYIWKIWVGDSYLGSTTQDIQLVGPDETYASVWPNWATDSAASIGLTSDGSIQLINCSIWNNWIEGAPNVITQSRTLIAGPARAVGSSAREVTPEQLEAARQRALRYEEEERERARKKQLATERAEALLLDNLNGNQKDEYKKFGFFHLLVGDKKYRIEKGIAGNIKLVRDGEDIERYCIHIPSNLPVQDNMLAQKLLLETDPKKFFQTANRTPLHPAIPNQMPQANQDGAEARVG